MFKYTHFTSSLPQVQIDAYVAMIDGFQVQLQGKVTAITEQINGMQSFLATYKSNESSALQQVELIKQQGEVTESTLGDNATLARLQVERAQTAYQNALENKNQNLATAQNNVDQSQIALNEAEDFLDKFEVSSPIKGSIDEVLVDVGEEVTVGAPLVTISSSDTQQVEISLTQEERGFVDIGQEIIVQNNGGQVKGIVSSVSANADENFTYKAIIELTETIDLYGELVSVEIDVRTEHILMPLNVVTILNSNEGLINTRSNGSIKPLRVLLGKIKGDLIEVRTQLDDDLVVIVSDIKNYNSTRHTLEETK